MLPTAPSASFESRPIAHALVQEILALAQRAPSGSNTQPWKVWVVQGAALGVLRHSAAAALAQMPVDAAAQERFWRGLRTLPGHTHWDGPRWERQEGDFVAAALAALGLAPGRVGAVGQLERYFALNGAPVALLCAVDITMGLGSVLDYGMFLQNLVVAAQARGLRADIQAGWRGLGDVIAPLLPLDEGTVLLAGVALGYPSDPPACVHPAAVWADSFITWHG